MFKKKKKKEEEKERIFEMALCTFRWYLYLISFFNKYLSNPSFYLLWIARIF